MRLIPAAGFHRWQRSKAWQGVRAFSPDTAVRGAATCARFFTQAREDRAPGTPIRRNGCVESRSSLLHRQEKCLGAADWSTRLDTRFLPSESMGKHSAFFASVLLIGGLAQLDLAFAPAQTSPQDTGGSDCASGIYSSVDGTCLGADQSLGLGQQGSQLGGQPGGLTKRCRLFRGRVSLPGRSTVAAISWTPIPGNQWQGAELSTTRADCPFPKHSSRRSIRNVPYHASALAPRQSFNGWPVHLWEHCCQFMGTRFFKLCPRRLLP